MDRERVTEEIVSAVVEMLRTELADWQSYLDSMSAGQARAGYSRGYRDALDQVIDDMTQRRWESHLASTAPKEGE